MTQKRAPVTAQEARRDNPVRRLIHTYLHLAGIEAGYGFFAPNVPDSYKLLFELRYKDGRREYVTIDDTNSGMALRFATLMDYIGRASSGSVRQLLIGFVTSAIWQQHPEISTIDAYLSALRISPPSQLAGRSEPDYELLESYEFQFDR